jgi:hypothetical protein
MTFHQIKFDEMTVGQIYLLLSLALVEVDIFHTKGLFTRPISERDFAVS